MQDMTLQDEWISQILEQSTKKSYAKGMSYFLEFLGLSKCEESQVLRQGRDKSHAVLPVATGHQGT